MEIERDATLFLNSVGIDPAKPGDLNIVDIAVRRLHRLDAVCFAGPHCAQLRGGDGLLIPTIDARYQILLNERLRDDQQRCSFVVARELARHYYRHLTPHPQVYRAAEALAAAILAPCRPFLDTVEQLEDGWLHRGFVDLAVRFRAAESLIALRLGETLCLPVCIVIPSEQRLRLPVTPITLRHSPFIDFARAAKILDGAPTDFVRVPLLTEPGRVALLQLAAA